jgi:hypothetical protein
MIHKASDEKSHSHQFATRNNGGTIKLYEAGLFVDVEGVTQLSRWIECEGQTLTCGTRCSQDSKRGRSRGVE